MYRYGNGQMDRIRRLAFPLISVLADELLREIEMRILYSKNIKNVRV